MRLGPPLACCVAALLVSLGPASRAQPEAPKPDAIETLQQGLKSGKVKLDAGQHPWGALPSLLKALDIPVDSQVLVFSRTSFQFDLIGPKRPRAIYFDDDTAVGAVQDGREFEILTSGADGRIAFYTFSTAPGAAAFEHPSEVCLSCHGTVDTWAAGMIVANVIPQEDGTPLYVTTDRLFNVTDSTTPFDERWGGWYVSGEHGAMRHKGNVRMAPDFDGELDATSGQNVTDLSSQFNVKTYLEPTSDIVALMTLEHQLGAVNRIWKVQAQVRSVRSEGAKRATPEQIQQSIDDLVGYLVGVHETPLPSPVKGVSTFTQTFPQRGPKDAHGRSLRDFDLKTHLFRYPLSYMVYSRAFNGIAPDVRERIYKRLFEVLSGADKSGDYAKLSPEGRKAALEILKATKPDLPPFWTTTAS